MHINRIVLVIVSVALLPDLGFAQSSLSSSYQLAHSSHSASIYTNLLRTETNSKTTKIFSINSIGIFYPQNTLHNHTYSRHKSIFSSINTNLKPNHINQNHNLINLEAFITNTKDINLPYRLFNIKHNGIDNGMLILTGIGVVLIIASNIIWSKFEQSLQNDTFGSVRIEISEIFNHY